MALALCWRGAARCLLRGAAAAARGAPLADAPGAGPRRPTDAELLDIFGTAGAGDGKGAPEVGAAAVLLRVRVASAGDILVDEVVEHVRGGAGENRGLAAGTRAAVHPALLDRCLADLPVGACRRFRCGAQLLALRALPEGRAAPSAVDVEVRFEAACEECDLAPCGLDGAALGLGLRKRTLRRGEGDRRCPRDGARVRFALLEVQGGRGRAAAPSAGQERHAALGDGALCDLLELALPRMQLGERARIFGPIEMVALAAADVGESLADDQAVSDVEASVTVELLEITHPTADEAAAKLADIASWARERKQVADQLFTQRRYILALAQYADLAERLSCLRCPSSRTATLVRTCKLNAAQCCLHVKAWKLAADICGEVLDTDPRNIKALYRRAVALQRMRKLAEAHRVVRTLLRVEPGNVASERLLKQIQEGLRVAKDRKKQRTKQVFQELCEEDIIGAGRCAERMDQLPPMGHIAGMPRSLCAGGGVSPELTLDMMPEEVRAEMAERKEQTTLAAMQEEYGLSEEEALMVRRRGGL